MDPIFSFYLTKNGKEGSFLTMGGYDVNRFGKGELNWLNIDPDNKNFWAIPMK
jgi:hypothetical protein